MFLLEALGVNLYLSLFQLLGATCILWLVATSFVFAATDNITLTSAAPVVTAFLTLTLPPLFPYRGHCGYTGPDNPG